MRGKVTDQDLTDYALNELKPDERFYVESMLAVSDECRHDVYRMLDLSQMLTEGFEQEEDARSILLNDEQRSKVLTVPRWHWRGFLRQAAAIALLAAGTSYALKQPAIWKSGGERLAGATTDMKDMVGDVRDRIAEKGVASTVEEYINGQFRALNAGDGPGLQDISAPAAAICTPSPILGMPEMPEIVPM